MHPRAPHDPELVQALRSFPRLRNKVLVAAPLHEVLATADCVLSCVSSAGIEAAAAGLPVVQLLPQGSGSILPADWYGLLGSARTLDELRPLLREALARRSPSVQKLDQRTIITSAARIAEVILAPRESRRRDEPHLLSGPHFTRRRAASSTEEASHG